jgi:hypothetical protein
MPAVGGRRERRRGSGRAAGGCLDSTVETPQSVIRNLTGSRNFGASPPPLPISQLHGTHPQAGPIHRRTHPQAEPIRRRTHPQADPSAGGPHPQAEPIHRRNPSTGGPHPQAEPSTGGTIRRRTIFHSLFKRIVVTETGDAPKFRDPVKFRVTDFRVDLGGYPPRPPTDPYVRDYRIRFLRSRFRYATSDPVTNPRVGQRVTLQKEVEPLPDHVGCSRAATEPLAPDPLDLVL